MQTKNLGTLYDLAPLDWADVAKGMDTLTLAPDAGGPSRHSCWLATIDSDGSPHVTGIGAIWVDGTFCFTSGAGTRKGRNLARDPRCSMSIATHDFDVVLEGSAARVTDRDDVARLAEVWAAGGWPCRVDESGSALTADYSAPSAGPPPWSVFRLSLLRATAVSTVEPGGATSWTF